MDYVDFTNSNDHCIGRTLPALSTDLQQRISKTNFEIV
jgi:hypothetical protein